MNRKPNRSEKTVHFISLGCPKNRVDTEAMLGSLAKMGYQFVNDPADASVVVVNTCGFVEPAVRESLAELRKLSRNKFRYHYRLIATGCLVQRMRKDLTELVPEIDSLIGVHGYRNLLRAIVRGGSYIPNRPCRYSLSYYQGRRLTTGPGWAYLRIADGCDNRCSYCLIPKLRGSYRSRRLEDIISEAKYLSSLGVREINIIAQDTTNYGVDLYGRRYLGRLLKKLDRVSGIDWIRLLYTHPEHFDDALIQELMEVHHLVRYLDIPLQHVSDRILRSMGRNTHREKIEALIDRLRHSFPGLVLRTTLMVGYPGETEEEFAELLAFTKRVGWERLGAFVYSPEPGTRAASLRDQVPRWLGIERWHRLMKEQRKISRERQRRRIGEITSVLIEGELIESLSRRDGSYRYFGRSPGEAPEVDGRIYIEGNVNLYPGQLTRVVVKKAGEYDLYGQVMEGAC